MVRVAVDAGVFINFGQEHGARLNAQRRIRPGGTGLKLVLFLFGERDLMQPFFQGDQRKPLHEQVVVQPLKAFCVPHGANGRHNRVLIPFGGRGVILSNVTITG